MILRDYQQRTIDQLYDWFSRGNRGNPCLVLPTGSGKSVIIAALCRDALQQWPETRVLMLTHVKELIEQNHAKMLAVWPRAPVGIYSASLGRKEIGEPITFAGIQSIRKKAQRIGHIDLIIVDECHMINHADMGGYRQLINDLTEINPHLRVIGLTATPWRLGHGRICDGDALFDDLIEPVSIEELIYRQYLAPLHSKQTDFKFNTHGIKKRGGEYIEADLQAEVNTFSNNTQVVEESIRRAGDRKAWLFFCAGVRHAEDVRDMLIERGIAAACVTGKTPKGERARIIEQFRDGEIKAVTNANVLTTGFDYPDIDFIGMLRPTMSPSLYMQMAGRGLRPKSHTDHCLVADFAQNINKHGPITNVRDPDRKPKGEEKGEPPVKVCPECQEHVAIAAKRCPACGFEFPEAITIIKQPSKLDIMWGNDDPLHIEVTSWKFSPHTSFSSGKDMIRITYYGALSDPPINEYLSVFHEGWAGEKAVKNLASICARAGIEAQSDDWRAWCDYATTHGKPPIAVEYTKDGKYFKVTRRVWE
jgi:DNA repair protein RadD